MRSFVGPVSGPGTHLDVVNVQTYGAVGDGVTDDVNAIQLAINAALATGAELFIPAGTYLISARSLTPATRTGSATFTSGLGQTLRIRGAGTRQTTLLAGQQFSAIGIIGYGESGVHPVLARLEVSDLTFDGNYSGAGGTVAQPASGAGALVSVYAPDQDASGHHNGKYHTFRNVRFYRPTGYGFQPALGVRIMDCEFDTMGQPAAASIHYDNIGSGEGDAIVIGNNWHDSTGNYVDFVDGSGTGFVRCIFIGNVSKSHTLGGVYAMGNRSVICGNTLENGTAGSAVAYDGGTNAAIRANNVVSGNTLTNLTVFNGDLTKGDLVTDNISSDSLATDAYAQPFASARQTGTLAETLPRYAVNSSAVPVGAITGTVYMAAVWLRAGTQVTNVVWVSGATAAVAPTHRWYGILDSTGKQVAHTADQTSAAVAASTRFSTALTAVYWVPKSGVYYIAMSATATTTNPSSSGVVAPTNMGVTGMTPFLAGVSPSAAQTTPGTDGTTTYTLPTTAGGIPYLYLT